MGEWCQTVGGRGARLFTRLVREIEELMAAHPEERPWTCQVYTGTDGSTIFRSGIGHSLIIDPDGRLWRARSYEDFDTTYRFTAASCEIEPLTEFPSSWRMREQRGLAEGRMRLSQPMPPRAVKGVGSGPVPGSRSTIVE
jgi:hypothetical protein